MRRNKRRRGSALLAVLWLSAALAAIAFSVAATVRSETDRVSSSLEGLKARYLAEGAITRAMLYKEWGPVQRNPDGSPKFYNGIPRYTLQFPSGEAEVEFIAESGKMNVNLAPGQDLFRLLAAMGVDAARAQTIVSGILNWRGPARPDSFGTFELQSSGTKSSFPVRHASMEEIEELLFIQGVTPDLFYGAYERDAQGVLRFHHGLRDCLSVFGGTGQFDANTAQPEVMLAAGVPPEVAAAIVQARRVRPFRSNADLVALTQGVPGIQRLGISTATLATVRATARPRRADGSLSDVRRSVAALVKVMDQMQTLEPYHVLRWYGNVWVE
jgi:general secretion pathway protein K